MDSLYKHARVLVKALHDKYRLHSFLKRNVVLVDLYQDLPIDNRLLKALLELL